MLTTVPLLQRPSVNPRQMNARTSGRPEIRKGSRQQRETSVGRLIYQLGASRPTPTLVPNTFRPQGNEKRKKGRKCDQPTVCLRSCWPSYQIHLQPDSDKCEGWRKFYRLLKNVCRLTGFLNLSAKLIYFTNLQRAHQSLRVILFLPELTAKIRAAHPNSYKIIISPFPDDRPRMQDSF